MYSSLGYPQFGAGGAYGGAVSQASYGGSSYGAASYAGSAPQYAARTSSAGAYAQYQALPSAREPARAAADSADVLGLLQKTLQEKDQEIQLLRAEAQRSQQKYEQQLQETRGLAVQKSKHIAQLEAELHRLHRHASLPQQARVGEDKALHQVGQPCQPLVPYKCVNKDDQVDASLECWYNQTSAEVDFKRINRGIYLFGQTQVEVDIINHKLMARTEDGWNRGKYAPVEKFLATYEPLEISRRARGKK